MISASARCTRTWLLLSVLAEETTGPAAIDIVFAETTTLGLRTSVVTREVLERDWTEVDIEGVPVRVKRGWREGRVVSAAPEHDDARRAAQATGLPLKEVNSRALREAERGP